MKWGEHDSVVEEDQEADGMKNSTKAEEREEDIRET
jgi:hypothetical protein